MEAAKDTATADIQKGRMATVGPGFLPQSQSSPPEIQMNEPALPKRAWKQPSPQIRRTEVLANLRWLVRLRWLAIVAIMCALLIAQKAGWIQGLGHPLLGVALLLLFNTWCFVTRCRQGDADPSNKKLLWILFLQLEVDLLVLTYLVHATGGVENPFVLMYVFPVALAAILLPGRMALLVCGSAILLYSGMILGELVETKSHRPFPGFLEELAIDGEHYRMLNSKTYVLALASAMALTLTGIVYFLQTLTRARRRSERKRHQHELVARSRERMARVGTVAAGLAHSIRNPLHGILNCVDLLEDSVHDQEASATLELMKEGLTRIESVTSRLLTLTREAPISPQLEDLNTQVLDTVHMFELRSKDKETRIHKKLDPFLPKIHLDGNRFHEALFNIIDNAHDAMGDHPGEILVRTYRIQEPFEGAAVEVRDSGEGISEKDLEKIFDPFFTTKPIGEGTGLGLGIARRVIEEHGGALRVTSIQGKGTSMIILLPKEDEDGLMEGGNQ